MKYDLIATATFGLEACVARELDRLGYNRTGTDAGHVRFEGDAEAVARSNTWLRTADRILVSVGSFAAPDFDALFDRTMALPWRDWLPREAAFPVTAQSVKSRLHSVPACQRTVKKAICKALMKQHRTSDLPESGATYHINLRLHHDLATLTIDTSGDGLHKRGYRRQAGTAPLKETLAAALLELSYWTPARPLLDPFCGSGTILIEAAMMARNLAPGRYRRFAAEAWPQLPSKAWQTARDEADAAVTESCPAAIIGCDIDAGVVQLAQRAAAAAGVAKDLDLRVMDARELELDLPYGCLITNPPYGERLGDKQEAEALYRDLPDIVCGLPTWSHYFLAADPDFEEYIGRQADRRRKLYNGKLSCQFYQFFGPPPSRADEDDNPRPAFDPLPQNAALLAEQFANRLRNRARHFRRWPKRGISCYRLYDRDVPGVPLIIDRYDDYLHISQYLRSKQLGGRDAWLDLLAATAAKTLDMPLDRVFVKRRERQSGTQQHEKLDDRSFTLEVNEGGLKFIVNLTDYIDTGLFLDHRLTRKQVREGAENLRVLNLFAYTGAFSVYAAAGGAAEVVTVDLSNRYLDWARRNMALNGFTDPQRYQYVSADVPTYLRRLPAARQFDLIIVDPPTFSNSKSTTTVWAVQRDHAGLIKGLLSHLAADGTLYFSANLSNLQFAGDELSGDCDIREITSSTVPEDFKGSQAHRCWLIRHRVSTAATEAADSAPPPAPP